MPFQSASVKWHSGLMISLAPQGGKDYLGFIKSPRGLIVSGGRGFRFIMLRLTPPQRGNVCPARAWRATFLLTIPTSARDLPSDEEAPQVDHDGLHTFRAKHVA